MKLFLLELIDSDDYDISLGFVIRAKEEKHARQLASQLAGDEKPDAWFDEKQTTCKEISVKGEEGILLHSFRHG